MLNKERRMLPKTDKEKRIEEAISSMFISIQLVGMKRARIRKSKLTLN